MMLTIIGTVMFLLLGVPFLLITQPIQRFTRISFFIALLLFLPALLLDKLYFDVGGKTLLLREFFSLSDSLAFVTLALLPLALKSIALLRKHEIRMFTFIINIFMFLFVSLIQPFVQVLSLCGKFIHHVLSS